MQITIRYNSAAPAVTGQQSVIVSSNGGCLTIPRSLYDSVVSGDNSLIANGDDDVAKHVAAAETANATTEAALRAAAVSAALALDPAADAVAAAAAVPSLHPGE